jgi:hypothetical protein
MPDSVDAVAWHTRGDMVRSINAEIEYAGFPARSRRQIDLVEVWRYIQTGGTKGHFRIRHMGYTLNFEQCTLAQYRESEAL